VKQVAGIAILGSGHIFHAPLWADALNVNPRAELVCLWDHDAARGEEQAARWGVPFVSDLHAALARDGLDGVAVCAENAYHADLIVAAAAAGKHVLCEKPMATTFADCRRIRRAVKEAGVRYFQSFPKRFDPVNRAVKRLLDAGDLGRPLLARVRHGHAGSLETFPGTEPYRACWFRDPDVNGGGAFLDEGVHATDLIAWLFGRPAQVAARMTRIDPEARADQAGIAVYHYANGLLVSLASGTVFAAADNTLEVWCERGSIIVTGTDLASKPFTQPPYVRVFTTGAGPLRWRELHVENGFKRADYHQRAVNAFVDCLCDDAEPAVGLREGEAALELVLAAYESARTGRAVGLPFQQDREYSVSEF